METFFTLLPLVLGALCFFEALDFVALCREK